jgi:hypothetical protein
METAPTAPERLSSIEAWTLDPQHFAVLFSGKLGRRIAVRAAK